MWVEIEYTQIRQFIAICMYIHIYIHTHTRTCLVCCVGMYMCVNILYWCDQRCLPTYMYICLMYTYINIFIFIDIYICISICIQRSACFR